MKNNEFKISHYELSGSPLVSIAPFDPESRERIADALFLYTCTLPPDEGEYFLHLMMYVRFEEAEKLLNEYRANKGEAPIEEYKDIKNIKRHVNVEGAQQFLKDYKKYENKEDQSK